ncbi:hypothetical protein BDP81DRAFT_422043 [Colletotrichum phormii]|uniref:Uncharacterized protein n=1 Tax=Colletotrichum phormii TaxID=359342 RepID=A0AAJ0EH01_9PEZI|nr:uncharacterized protein BDP81DRAFT_422043 [Colletotrichum phormii]KAK1639907.1 hypothetical protein BDP81DRAFT_422043 [Colletotrichum phormii]
MVFCFFCCSAIPLPQLPIAHRSAHKASPNHSRKKRSRDRNEDSTLKSFYPYVVVIIE